MIGADHSFNSIPYFITFISGIAATWLTLYFKVIRPRMAEHRKHEEERDQQRHEEHDWLHGKPATMGSPEIISAPVQLRAVQDSQTQVVASVNALTVRMDEANGTAKRTENSVAEIRNLVETLAGRPPATVAEVKAVVAEDHDRIEQRQTEILDVLHEKT